MSEQVQSRYSVFYSSTPSMQVIDSRGQAIIFVSGRFHTKDESKIAFLNQMIEDGSTAVFVNPSQLTMSEDDLDPMEALRRKHIAEFLAEQANHLDPEKNISESKQGPINAASTTSIASVTANGGQSALSEVKAKLMATTTAAETKQTPAA